MPTFAACSYVPESGNFVALRTFRVEESLAYLGQFPHAKKAFLHKRLRDYG